MYCYQNKCNIVDTPYCMHNNGAIGERRLDRYHLTVHGEYTGNRVREASSDVEHNLS